MWVFNFVYYFLLYFSVKQWTNFRLSKNFHSLLWCVGCRQICGFLLWILVCLFIFPNITFPNFISEIYPGHILIRYCSIIDEHVAHFTRLRVKWNAHILNWVDCLSLIQYANVTRKLCLFYLIFRSREKLF